VRVTIGMARDDIPTVAAELAAVAGGSGGGGA